MRVKLFSTSKILNSRSYYEIMERANFEKYILIKRGLLSHVTSKTNLVRTWFKQSHRIDETSKMMDPHDKFFKVSS